VSKYKIDNTFINTHNINKATNWTEKTLLRTICCMSKKMPIANGIYRESKIEELAMFNIKININIK